MVKQLAKQKKILIIEDTRSIALVYKSWLEKNGFCCETVEDGKLGLEKLEEENFELALLDLDLPGASGLEILCSLQNKGMDTPVVVVTASGSVSTAIEAMRSGACDFLVKPTSEGRLLSTVKDAIGELSAEKKALVGKVSSVPQSVDGMIGSSLTMTAISRAIESVAGSTASVFITGESGTGKEVCAQAIHDASPRRGKAFVPLNCAAIPKDLMESEIFGHVAGAFTGATTDRVGAAHSANGGTLFLDEICEMDLSLQSKLLRFLQTGMVQKVGSDQPTQMDVRILCATNRDPALEVKEGRFREDLFYRLHVLPLHLPPLRERGEDCIEIFMHFLDRYSVEEGKKFISLSEDAKDLLLAYQWPGNVRELMNIVRKAVILNNGEILTSEMLDINAGPMPVETFEQDEHFEQSTEPQKTMLAVNIKQDFATIEREILEAAIAYCDNSIPRASEMLGLSPSTIYRKRDSWDNERDPETSWVA